ncbi:MAG TPA: hypothetical protein VJX29_08265, partial [Candidatus Acidoferrales bacterium]|nr:hypothetical protein [Candidatus Acidoferrales bacterium]
MKSGAKASLAALMVAALALGALFAAGHAAPAARARSAAAGATDTRLKGAYRFEEGGWIYAHLEGTPEQVGFQHGYLLSTEITDALHAVRLDSVYRTHRSWKFFRDTASTILWLHMDEEYQKELTAIADGVNAHESAASPLDVWDIVALNAFEEVTDYYVPLLDAKERRPVPPLATAPGNCSAFVATGSYTKDHRIVMAHNN